MEKCDDMDIYHSHKEQQKREKLTFSFGYINVIRIFNHFCEPLPLCATDLTMHHKLASSVIFLNNNKIK